MAFLRVADHFRLSDNFHGVMDYMVGGDFLGLLIRKDTLREDWARFYIAEMILLDHATNAH
jgi:hypothetical protein